MQNVNIGKARTTGSKQQQLMQKLQPPPHPDLPEAKEWHREHFRRQGSDTPDNHRLAAASGKIGLVGKIGLTPARHQIMVKEERFSKSSDRKTRTLTVTCLQQGRISRRPKV